MAKHFNKTDYTLQSIYSGNTFIDTDWMLDAPGEDKPGLIRAMYENRQLNVKDNGYGIYNFADSGSGSTKFQHSHLFYLAARFHNPLYQAFQEQQTSGGLTASMRKSSKLSSSPSQMKDAVTA